MEGLKSQDESSIVHMVQAESDKCVRWKRRFLIATIIFSRVFFVKSADFPFFDRIKYEESG